jgi:hypothetical protein
MDTPFGVIVNELPTEKKRSRIIPGSRTLTFDPSPILNPVALIAL